MRERRQLAVCAIAVGAAALAAFASTQAAAAAARVTLEVEGRFVELQRLAAHSWTRVRRAVLVAHRREFGSFSATFTVRRRGLTVRIVVPEASAGPCFDATLSQTFVS